MREICVLSTVTAHKAWDEGGVCVCVYVCTPHSNSPQAILDQGHFGNSFEHDLKGSAYS